MIWQTPGACEPEGVLGSLGAWRVRCQPRASHVPCPRGESSWDAESSWARRLQKSERGSLSRFISSLLGDAFLPCFPSWLLFVASSCQDVPGIVRSLLLWEMDVTRSQDDSIFSSAVAWWVTVGETVSLEHTSETMHGIML